MPLSGWFNWPEHGWRNNVPEEVLRQLAPEEERGEGNPRAQ